MRIYNRKKRPSINGRQIKNLIDRMIMMNSLKETNIRRIKKIKKVKSIDMMMTKMINIQNQNELKINILLNLQNTKNPNEKGIIKIIMMIMMNKIFRIITRIKNKRKNTIKIKRDLKMRMMKINMRISYLDLSD
jgi:hypothetical protein